LYVPEEFEGDPVMGLSPEQREFLTPGDQVIAIFEREGDGGSIELGEPTFTWRDGLFETPWDAIDADSISGFVRDLADQPEDDQSDS
jgi:hypothetical protein